VNSQRCAFSDKPTVSLSTIFIAANRLRAGQAFVTALIIFAVAVGDNFDEDF
jgi:hypothetical protein